MKIANPIYDVVFKYLMEDIEIAKAILSAILNIEIVSLEMKPQELSTQYSDHLRLVRIDFKATIRTKEGSLKIVLIEIQKSKKGLELLRFRRYLALNYSKLEDIINEQGEAEQLNIPITTIYFLGFKLKKVTVPVLKVVREYYNATTGRRLKNRDNFIETLSHDLYAIQIPRLNMVAQTEMEKMLDVFSQVKYKTKDNKILEFTGEVDNPMVERMLKRLNMALLDEDVIRQMQFEEEIETEFNMVNKKLLQAIEAKEQAIEATKQAKEATKQANEATKQAINEKEEAKKKLAEVSMREQELLKTIEAMKKGSTQND